MTTGGIIEPIDKLMEIKLPLELHIKLHSVIDIKRDDIDLVAIIEEYGSEFACGYANELVVIDIPDDVKWYIEIQDEELGDELIVEEHRTW